MKVEFDLDNERLSNAITDHAMSQCYRMVNAIVAEKATLTIHPDE